MSTSVGELCVLALAALLVRLLVGLHGYSGQGDAPRFGDYEAQRHWMEITLSTPILEWYIETPNNPLQYWGLDYPPLSAYQSYATGLLLQALEPEAVQLGSSRGYETPSSKRAMRLTVVLADCLVLLPFLLHAARATARLLTQEVPKDEIGVASGPSSTRRKLLLLLSGALLLQPAFILIDHGHFQFNGIALGFAAGAIAEILEGRHLTGSALFVLAINHKHMLLYLAPAFFFYLLGTCVRPLLSRGAGEGVTNSKVVAAIGRVAALGTTVIATMLLVWSPFLTSPSVALKVAQRLAPVHRGLFEDYVANFWCATHVAVKWKRLLSQPALVRLCTASTLLAMSPACVHQLLRPSRTGFLYCLANCSLAFYLFSYQVHEKGILIPMLPATLLIALEPAAVLLVTIAANFSMLPLLERDGQLLPYLALTTSAALLLPWATTTALCGDASAAFAEPSALDSQQQSSPDQGSRSVDDTSSVLSEGATGAAVVRRRGSAAKVGSAGGEPGKTLTASRRSLNSRRAVQRSAGLISTATWQRVALFSWAGMAALHVVRTTVAPPERLPYLHDALLTAYAFVHFFAFFGYMTYSQLTLHSRAG